MAEKDYMATRLFKDRTSAEQEYDALVGRGYSADDINVVMTEEGRRRHFGTGATTELGNKALEGAGVGAESASSRAEPSGRSRPRPPWPYRAWDCSWRVQSPRHFWEPARAASREAPSARSWARAFRKSA